MWWNGLSKAQTESAYREMLAEESGRSQAMRYLCQTDLFYLLVYGCGRQDMNSQWCFDRCREVQSSPDGHLDLWSREHYKSSIITFGQTLQDIINDTVSGKDPTVCILSYNRPTSKVFMRQLKLEAEANKLLQGLFPEVFWVNPRKESPKWSEDDGLILKRTGNPRESTIEAYGLVDSMPTGRHYGLIVWDDVVTKESVTTPEMIKKVTEAWELSLNLESAGCRKRMVGTRYHYNDTYATVIERGSMNPRIYPATGNGKADGNPVMWDRATLDAKRRDMGPHVFACQLLLDPKKASEEGFKEEWLKFWSLVGWEGMNRYITVDPASSKGKSSDYTAMIVWGLGEDGNRYVIDMVRDRLNLTQRTEKLMDLAWKYRPILGIGYEKYGLQADIEHVQTEMDRRNRRFKIVPLGGSLSKQDRIKMLIPHFEQGRVYLPHALHYIDYEGKSSDLVRTFIRDEYMAFPVGQHEDVLDAMARILDEELHAFFPLESKMGGIQKATNREIDSAYEDEDPLGRRKAA